MNAHREAGFAQAWALLLLVLLGTSVQLAVGRSQRLQRARTMDHAAFVGLQSAEAGFAKGCDLIRDGEREGRWNFDVEGTPVSLELRTLSDSRIELRSTAIARPTRAESHAVRKTIRVVLEPQGQGALPRVIRRSESRL